MVCQLKAGANREGFAVLDLALSQSRLQLELRGDRVLMHDDKATQFLDCRQALHALLHYLMLMQSVGEDE